MTDHQKQHTKTLTRPGKPEVKSPDQNRGKEKIFRATNASAEREKSRAVFKKAKNAKTADNELGAEETKPYGKWVQIRLIPIWLRVILFFVVLAAAVALGLMFGYGVLGGGKASDVLKWETWQHILDLIQGKV